LTMPTVNQVVVLVALVALVEVRGDLVLVEIVVVVGDVEAEMMPTLFSLEIFPTIPLRTPSGLLWRASELFPLLELFTTERPTDQEASVTVSSQTLVVLRNAYHPVGATSTVVKSGLTLLVEVAEVVAAVVVVVVAAVAAGAHLAVVVVELPLTKSSSTLFISPCICSLFTVVY